MLKQYISLKNLGETYQNIYDSVRSGIPTAAFGVSFSEKCHIASGFDMPILYIVKDAIEGVKATSEITALTGERAVFLNAKDDVLLYKKAFNKDSLYRRIAALNEIKSGVRFVVATFESLLQLFPKDVISLSVKKGGDYDLEKLIAQFIEMGYKREEFAEDKGSFAVRGDIMEVFPVNGEYVYRCDFFGDEIESVKKYYPDNKDDKQPTDGFTAICANDFSIGENEKESLKNKIKESVKKFGTLLSSHKAKEIGGELYEMLDNDITDSALSFLMPVLNNVTDDIFSYLPENTVVCYDECKLLSDNLTAIIKEHTERCLALERGGEAFDFTMKQLSDSETLIKRLNKHRQIALQSITTAINFFNPLKTFSVKCTPITRYALHVEDLYADLANWKFNKYRVIICCSDDKKADKLFEDIESKKIFAELSDTFGEDFSGIKVTSFYLPSGFILHEAKLVVLGTGDIYIEASKDRRIRKKRNDLFQAPEVGDFAVHEVHGIGYVKGTRRISTQEGTKDYIAVEYQGGDILYVSVEQMDKLTKYVGGGEHPTLNKIGGKEFDRIKERVRASIAKMTINLKKLYAERAEKKGFVFSPDNAISEEFDEAFPYDETEDQLQSIAEIKKDMESDKVMDRLLCGDVGFGKTEVAFRAVLKAVLDGKQAALVCPTTILCEQHYINAIKRFEGFRVRMASLNRFRTVSEQSRIVSGLRDGDIDFVIGTHRLFGSDVKFQDLGLLVLDEEHRFGVEHKEKLKLLKENVDTLTMSATPIPRTLHMSLSGIRDISTINTPPKERIPVQTYVVEESDALIHDAVTRELARNGQVLIMYNRVESIRKFAANVISLVPDAKTLVAHGQMERKELEESVLSFYKGEYNVLIATTIIENGIDLPKANTLIVIDADRLGLSTLYQLKGRVGRSNIMAHAYFTFKRDKVMSDTAYKRLSAIMEFTEMGSGYKIAMRDLEIRGAGNVMGKEQHGHMDKVGYELYSKLLKESLGEVTKDFDTELDIRISAFIPDNYIESSSSRMDCYKQIAEIKNEEDRNRVLSSLLDSYGSVPQETENLISIAMLKNYAKKIEAVKVTVTNKIASLTLKNLNSLNNEKLMNKINSHKNLVTLSFSENPVILFNSAGITGEEAVNGMTEFLKSD